MRMDNSDSYNGRETVAVLWTGGWDSTYRVIELSKQDVNIQPVYILDENRKSNKIEQEAIAQITKMLRQRQETIATFLPLDVIKVSDIPENKEITSAWQRLKDEFDYGIQHDWTARVAHWKYPMIDMCIEKVIKGYAPTRRSIKKYGAIKKIPGGGGIVIDRKKSDPVLNLVLGFITLPIFEITEVEMFQNIRDWGYMDVMEKIWFCHTPIDGKPCGLCSPCHTKMNSNMEFLLPKASQRRCKHLNWIKNKLGKRAGRIYSILARRCRFI